MKIQVKQLHPLAQLPKRGTDLSAGFDLVACIDKPMSIRYGEKATLIPTGLAIWIGSVGAYHKTMGLILPRSGLGHKQGLVLGNTVGVVDADYQNEWFVSAWNRGQQDEIIINPGDRFAQVVFVPVAHPEFEIVEQFDANTVRGLGGFGSTGVGDVKMPINEGCEAFQPQVAVLDVTAPDTVAAMSAYHEAVCAEGC